MYIWYPGRPPECTPELLQHLTTVLELFDDLVAHRDSVHLDAINRQFGLMCALVGAEQDACLDSDLSLRDFRMFCEQVPQATALMYTHEDWKALFEISVGVTDLHQSLEIDHAHTCPTPEVASTGATATN
jgi:hypothetical protein